MTAAKARHWYRLLDQVLLSSRRGGQGLRCGALNLGGISNTRSAPVQCTELQWCLGDTHPPLLPQQ